jgi:Pyrimidine dimer DNA glycosylase
MRQWLVDPKLLCRKHLLGEHVESHMFLGTIKKGISVNGYVSTGLFDPAKLYSRHDELVTEMLRRGYGHYSDLEVIDISKCTTLKPCIDVEANLRDLFNRCSECRELQILAPVHLELWYKRELQNEP